MDNDKIITARIEDKLEQCERGSYITATGFLNMHEQSLSMRIVRGRSDVKSFFYGGYEDAERRIIMFVPDGYADTLEEALEMISHFRCFASRWRLAAESSRIGIISGLSSRLGLIGL